jgi:hypothetical protein
MINIVGVDYHVLHGPTRSDSEIVVHSCLAVLPSLPSMCMHMQFQYAFRTLLQCAHFYSGRA